MNIPVGIKRSPPIVLTASQDVEALYLAGTGSTLVVSFSGVGTDRSIAPPPELVGTASNDGANHVLVLTDLKRTWYSQPQVQEEIRLAFDRAITLATPKRIAIIGNSMGAYGALLFAQEMAAETVVALGPQFSMTDTVVRERRWSEFRPNFGTGLAREIGASIKNFSGTSWILHGLMGPDFRHLERFEPDGRTHHGILPGLSHGFASELKKRGVLKPFVAAAVSRDESAAKDILAPLGVLWRRAGEKDELVQLRAARQGLIRQRAARRERRQMQRGT